MAGANAKRVHWQVLKLFSVEERVFAAAQEQLLELAIEPDVPALVRVLAALVHELATA